VRQRYLVTYDVCDPTRLRKVFKVMKGFGSHVQYSVFVCDLKELGLAELKSELLAVIDPTQDQVLLVDVGPTEGRGIGVFESLGKPYHERAHLALVV
jgi:CRISPR-associated protein Cas2